MNDLAAKERATRMVSGKSEVTEVTGVAASDGRSCSVTAPEDREVTEVTIPPSTERPCYRVFEKPVQHDGRSYRPGVWYFAEKQTEKHGAVSIEEWLCAPLYVEAVTHDDDERNYGRLLRFQRTRGGWTDYAMPMELLAGSGEELRRELLRMGLELDPRHRQNLPNYLQNWTPRRFLECTTATGWLRDTFVLPDEVIGPDAASVVFQSVEHESQEYATAGTLEGWCHGIAALAPGNPLLLVSLSAAFAGPLLSLCHAESGGIHLVGDSSTGKTAAVTAACSVWGGERFKRSWRATANGMEGAASLFNDCLLALDEISEADPREVGSIIYALGNGQGKQRAARNGSTRPVKHWRCSVLSSGEVTVETAMREAGHRAKAGQSVRLLDLPATRQHGAWDELHGMTGAGLSDALKAAAAEHYGHAGREYLRRLALDARDFAAELARVVELPGFTVEDGQGRRGARRLAIIALAGELATEYGITGWPEGAAMEACMTLFREWHAARGTGPSERRKVLEQVSLFLERHGDGRFSSVDKDGDVRDRAGWWREDAGRRLYLFNGAGLREALAGSDFKRALDHLESAGALLGRSGAQRSKPQRVGNRTVRLYTIDPEALEADGNGA